MLVIHERHKLKRAKQNKEQSTDIKIVQNDFMREKSVLPFGNPSLKPSKEYRKDKMSSARNKGKLVRQILPDRNRPQTTGKIMLLFETWS